MADIGSITQGSSYTGNAALGGGLAIAAVIDTTPLQRLATFSYYRDRDMWNKKNEDDKDAAAKIAAMSAYDINSPLKPFSEDLKKSLQSIQEYVRNNPDSLVWSRDPEKFAEREKMINDFLNKRKGATANDVLYNSAKAQIEKISDPRQRDLRRRELDSRVDKLFSEGLERAYNTQMDALPDLKESDYKIPSVAYTSRSFVDVGPNNNLEVNVEYGDPDNLLTQSEILAASPANEIDVNSPQFQNLSPEEQKLELEKQQLYGSKRAAIQKVASDFKSLLDQWKAANPNIDLNTIDPTVLPDGTLEDNIRSAILINKQIDELNGYVSQGKILDKNGFTRDRPYSKININDGLSEAELIMMKSIQENGNTLIKKIDKNLTYTGDQTRRQGQLLDFQASQFRASSGDPLKAAIENPAKMMGQHIDRVKNFYNSNKAGTGVLKVRFDALDDDTRKALGITDSEAKSQKKYVIYNRDGSVKVGVDGKNAGGTPLTLEQLQQGYVDVVKSGLADKGVNSEGFQTNAEGGYKRIFGTNDVRTLWNNWDQFKQNITTTTTNAKSPETVLTKYKIKGKVYDEKQLLDMGYTIQQIAKFKQ